MWIVNFYVFSPLLFKWFGMSPPLVQFFAHTFFFGMMLGVLLFAFKLPTATRMAAAQAGPKPSVQ